MILVSCADFFVECVSGRSNSFQVAIALQSRDTPAILNEKRDIRHNLLQIND
jgi:hypothetical protein